MNKAEKKEYDRKYYIKNRKKIKEREKIWYIANRKEILEKQKKYNADHKEERKVYIREYRAENPWENHHHLAEQRCNNPNNKDYRYYGGKGIQFKLTKDEVRTLYLRDNASEMVRPSIDRIYTDRHYVFGNCRFIEIVENITKRHMENKRRVK